DAPCGATSPSWRGPRRMLPAPSSRRCSGGRPRARPSDPCRWPRPPPELGHPTHDGVDPEAGYRATPPATGAPRVEVTMHVVLLGSAFPGHPEAGVDRVHVRRALSLAARVPVVVVVPTPWAPSVPAGPNGRWARYAATPKRAEIDGVRLLFPRYLQVPRMGPWAGVAMALGAMSTVEALRCERRGGGLFAQAALPAGGAAGAPGRRCWWPL